MSRTVAHHWERACGYLRDRQLPAARAQLESLCALAPDDWRTRLLAARLAWHAGHPAAAAAHALEAARAVPDDPAALSEVIETLLDTGESAAAHALVDRPVWATAGSGDVLLRYVDFRQSFGEHADALTAIDRVLVHRSDDGVLHCHRGQQLEFLGRLDEAAIEYEACLQRAPAYGHAAYQRVRLPRPVAPDQLLATIETGMQRAEPGSRAQADFGFARHHVLEVLGRFVAAWDALVRANAIMHARTAAGVAQQQAGLQRFSALLAATTLRAAAPGASQPQPIFILGLPRSGSTVLERMLGNHPRVAVAGELADFGRQLLRVADTRSAWNDAFAARLPALDFADVGRAYLAQVGWRAHGKAWLVDKQPANWMLAGLIRAALPDAKILHVVRDPMDTCFSQWRARFTGGTYAWSYDLATLAEHHRAYRGLMQLWHARYPGTILDVAYADLVREPAATLREVLDFCGLPWEPGCEDLTRNAMPVATLSAAAVREPVNTRGFDGWRRYARQLEPLRQALSPMRDARVASP